MVPGHFLINYRFQDAYEFAQTAREWNLDIKQLVRGSFRSDLTQFGMENVLVTHARFSLASHQQGDPPSDLRTFGIMADWAANYSPSAFIWRRKPVPTNAVLAFPAGDELDVICRMGFAVYTLSFSEELLADICRSEGLPDLDEILGGQEVVQAESLGMQRLRGHLNQMVLHLKKDSSLMANPLFQDEIRFQLPHELMLMLSLSRERNTRPQNRIRDLAMKRIEDYLKAYPQQYHTVRNLCQVANVSERTLRYAFRERFGISPKSYLMALRLNGFRRELKNADTTSSTITDLATRWGFWHMSQFAADYRRFFGELPSTTFKKTRSINRTG